MVSILVLVKLNGKQRLVKVYTKEQRRSLILFMFERMLEVLEGLSIYVATPDDLSRDSCEIIRDEWGDINKAIANARAAVKDDFLILPCDLPFVEREDIDMLLCEGTKVRIVPSQDGGTNALLLPATAEIETQFGENSFERHLSLLKCNNLEYEILKSDQFRDVDTEEDILWALEHKKDSEFSRFVRQELQ